MKRKFENRKLGENKFKLEFRNILNTVFWTEIWLEICSREKKVYVNINSVGKCPYPECRRKLGIYLNVVKQLIGQKQKNGSNHEHCNYYDIIFLSILGVFVLGISNTFE